MANPDRENWIVAPQRAVVANADAGGKFKAGLTLSGYATGLLDVAAGNINAKKDYDYILAIRDKFAIGSASAEKPAATATTLTAALNPSPSPPSNTKPPRGPRRDGPSFV